LYFAFKNSACVPLPAPGFPKRTMLIILEFVSSYFIEIRVIKLILKNQVTNLMKKKIVFSKYFIFFAKLIYLQNAK
jgi:hypothetical protein